MTKHKSTPTPWESCGNFIRTPMPDGSIIAEMSLYQPNHADDSAYLVRCVNAHDDLVAALKKLVDFNSSDNYAPDSPVDLAYKEARAAIAKATQ